MPSYFPEVFKKQARALQDNAMKLTRESIELFFHEGAIIMSQKGFHDPTHPECEELHNNLWDLYIYSEHIRDDFFTLLCRGTLEKGG